MNIVQHDMLVVDQVTSFMANDFSIRDDYGHVVGRIVTEGSALSRMFLGSRQLAVVENDGSVAVRVVDPPSFGRDHFELTDAAGQKVAQIRKEFSLFSKRLSIALAGGEVLDLKGEFFEYDFTVTGQAGEAARVARQWPGLADGLLGWERYVLRFAPGSSDAVRHAVLGGVVALDLIRAKERRG